MSCSSGLLSENLATKKAFQLHQKAGELFMDLHGCQQHRKKWTNTWLNSTLSISIYDSVVFLTCTAECCSAKWLQSVLWCISHDRNIAKTKWNKLNVAIFMRRLHEIWRSIQWAEPYSWLSYFNCCTLSIVLLTMTSQTIYGKWISF